MVSKTIGIDATALNAQRTGTVTYVVEIVKRFNLDKTLSASFVVFVTVKNRHHFERLSLDERFTLVQAPTGRIARAIWQQTALIWQLWRRRVSVHWGPTFVLPCYAPCPCVVTVHDMTFDLCPQAHERIKRIYFPFMIRRAVARAHTVLAVSEHTAQDLARLIPKSKAKTRVTLLAASQLAQRSDLPTADLPIIAPFVLTVGTLEPRKNIPRLIAAWQQLEPAVRGAHRLLVVGAMGWLLEDLQASLSDDPSIVFAGHLPDDQLQACLQVASAFAYPSLYEGFGLPVLEAMAAAVPVMTSNVGATLEVAGVAALLVNPTSVDEISHGLARLLSEPELCQALAAAGKARARQFSWEATARQTFLVMEEAGKASGITVR
jgi:glycosyltransferase involved in cell wall biosynthesis